MSRLLVSVRQMPGLLICLLLYCCTVAAPLTGVEGTGVFEVQLTSLINGWGLTHQGSCCSRHNHIRNSVTSSDNGHRAHDASGDRNSIENQVDSNVPGMDEEEEEEEDDWECELECRTFMRVCLSHLQDLLPQSARSRDWSRDSACTFGAAVSPVLGGNMLDPFGMWGEMRRSEDMVNPDTVVRVPFTFSWPAAYTLVVEAWHDDSGNRSTDDPRHMIARAVQGGRLLPSPLWHNHSISSIHTDLSFRFRVVCDENYYGPGCDVLCRESDDPIFGHYRCDANGSRVCLPGWVGESCDRAECSEACVSAHGFCEVPNECRCRLGWKGPDCQQCQIFPGCLHGFCRDAWQCICEQGWSGSLCNVDNYYCQRHSPCQNGGTCVYDNVSNYTCACTEGFGGPNCEHAVCYDGFCLNSGLCMMEGNMRTCRCRRGFGGRRCQHAEVSCGSLACRNNGTCTQNGADFRCLCQPGFTGSWCEHEVDECESNPCRNGGICRDRINGYHCECQAGHAGRNCDFDLDPCTGYRCFNHGTCITVGAGFTPSCLCRPDFTGERCERPLDPCVGISCLHGGTCLQTGPSSFRCACANGYTGSVCQILPPSVVCKDQPCLHGGTCLRGRDGTVRCACLPGFEGALCEARVITTESPVTVTDDSEGREGDGGGGGDDGGGGGGDEVSSEKAGIEVRHAKDFPRNFEAPYNSGAQYSKNQSSQFIVLTFMCVSNFFIARWT